MKKTTFLAILLLTMPFSSVVQAKTPTYSVAPKMEKVPEISETSKTNHPKAQKNPSIISRIIGAATVRTVYRLIWRNKADTKENERKK